MTFELAHVVSSLSNIDDYSNGNEHSSRGHSTGTSSSGTNSGRIGGETTSYFPVYPVYTYMEESSRGGRSLSGSTNMASNHSSNISQRSSGTLRYLSIAFSPFCTPSNRIG